MSIDNFPVYKAITERRTIRKFSQKQIPEETLKRLINTARVAPSGGNRQPLDYIVINEPALCAKLFPLVKWAGYIAPNGDPKEGEEPTAYFIVLVDRDIKSTTSAYDVGAAAENIQLAAWEDGIGCCWQGAIMREEIRALFEIPLDVEIDCVISLGYKAESPVIEDYKGSIKYWQDENKTLHVPKRKLEDILRWNKYSR